MAAATPRYDVLMVTDCRFPGGTSSSVVEEVLAQHRAGYRTGILHLPSTVLTHARPFNPKIRQLLARGEAELVLGVDEVEARLVLARHPTVFSSPPEGLPRVHTDEVVLAVNQVAVDDRAERPYYDVPQVARNLERLFGHEATWAPIGPRVRSSMHDLGSMVPLLHWDWENVIDVDAWRVDRSGFVGDRPVIGRHSRGHWTKWPDDPAQLLAAYPDDPRYVVSVLGGSAAPRRVLGRIPDNWVDHPFDSIPAADFLATIDFFVYFHHPGLIEAFGRVVLEALSAGAVCVVPPYLEPLFGDVCLYGEPRDVRAHVDALYADPAAYRDRSDRGVRLAVERFSYDTHIRRVEELIGPPSLDPPASSTTPRAASARPTTRKRILLVDLRERSGSEVTPLSAVATAVGEGHATLALVDASVAALVGDALAVETLPRALDQLDHDSREAYRTTRISELLLVHRPQVVIVLTDAEPPEQLTTLADEGVEVLAVVHGRLAAPPSPGNAADPSDGVAADVAAALPEGWTARQVAPRERLLAPAAPAPQRAAGAPQSAPAPEGMVGRAKVAYWAALRRGRKLRGWARSRGRRMKPYLRPAVTWARGTGAAALERAAARTGQTVVRLDRDTTTLPTSGPVTHPDPASLPTALIVVPRSTGPDVIQQLAQRQQETSGFHLALLVPRELEPAAHAFGYAVETLVPREAWTRLGVGAYDAYLRARVRSASRFTAPHTVLLHTGEDAELDLLLDVLEATGAPPPR
jgi:hypothetical protein